VILLDEADRVLLVRFEYEGRSWWGTPGGGLEPGESHKDAARRELREETGLLSPAPLGPLVWTREHVYEFGGRLYRQQERYFLARTRAFAPRPTALGDDEAGVLRGLRWWTLGEFDATTEETAPADLPTLVRRLVEDGPPRYPVEVVA
jgi:8-oxo-dGTP pyrophosphatase MutT (NUDIX family)